jgi:lipoprotein signal peptidase
MSRLHMFLCAALLVFIVWGFVLSLKKPSSLQYTIVYTMMLFCAIGASLTREESQDE